MVSLIERENVLMLSGIKMGQLGCQRLDAPDDVDPSVHRRVCCPHERHHVWFVADPVRITRRCRDRLTCRLLGRDHQAPPGF
jgi:hypothetical protein